MKKPIIIISASCILLLVIGMLWFAQVSLIHKNVIYPKISIEGVNVGGKTKEDAVAYLKKRYPPKKNVTVVFTLKGESIATISATQLTYSLPIDEAVTAALQIGRDKNASFIQNVATRFTLFTGTQLYKIPLTPHYNEPAVQLKIEELADAYRTEPIDARFEFKDNKVTAFAKEQPGYYLDTASVQDTVRSYLSSPATKQAKSDIHYIGLNIKPLQPRLQLKDSNTLGIVELVASGSSRFAGSIAERVHNITIGAQRLNGTIIHKDQTFSFVTALGDISRATGFKPAYIIKNGRTVLDDGGGICQVSTTIFRAALNGGLPITERHAHAYRVGYYEQDALPGLDATIYSPTVDLKFKNDYSSALLIQTIVDAQNATLTVFLYGTKDSRTVSLGTPILSNQSAPPPAEYIDEPTLPNGTVKQVDFSAPGALSRFTYVVEKDGKKIINETFTSNYRPWKAIYLRGTM